MNIFKKVIDFFKKKKRNHIRVPVTPYVDPSLRELSKKRWYIKGGARVGGLYLIALTGKKEEPLVIIKESELYKRFAPEYDMTVVGLSATKETAFKLICDIYQDVYDATGRALDVEGYFAGFQESDTNGES